MSNVERFFHIRGATHKGGATVRVVGDMAKPGNVDVQVAVCSRKDNFCKKTGRDLAEKASIKAVPLRYLPQELARIEDKLIAEKRIRPSATYGLDFSFATKYFLPKE